MILFALLFHVNVVAPGLVETPLTDWGLRSDPEGRRQVIEQIPLRRIGTVEDVAGAIAFLASEDASYITGQVLIVDGGMVTS